MILACNSKSVSSQLFGCGRGKPGLQGQGRLHHLMYITELLLVLPVGHMNPYVTDWVTKSSSVPREFELVTYQSKSDASTYRIIHNDDKKIWLINK